MFTRKYFLSFFIFFPQIVFLAVDIAMVRESQIREKLEVCSRRIQDIESAENVLKQNTLSAEAPLSRDLPTKMSPTFQELRKLT